MSASARYAVDIFPTRHLHFGRCPCTPRTTGPVVPTILFMNILYIHCHDAGRWVSPWSDFVETPHLENFAASGMLLEQAFCAAPTCSPSRGSLLTGRYPHQNGLVGLTHRGFSMAERDRHLAVILRSNGWETWVSGIQHEFADESPQSGFPYQRLDGTYLPDQLQRDQQTTMAVENFFAKRPRQPFFLACGFALPHRIFPEPEPRDAWRGSLPDGLLPDTPEVRADFAAYRRAVREMDACAGRVFDALERSGLADKTAVVFTTDHGPAFPGMKGQCTDGGVGVAMAFRIPGLTRAGSSSDALVSQIDFVPTLLELLELPVADDLDGVSLLPLLGGGRDFVREEVFAETNYHVSAEFTRMVRTRTHKLIRRFHPSGGTVVWPNIDPSPTKEAWRIADPPLRPLDKIELYDLQKDPLEKYNLSNDPSLAATRNLMERKLDTWMRRTNDPLLEGLIPPPLGARLE